MERKIVVYGNGDKRPYPVGFPTEALFQRWIKEDIFGLDGLRYRYSQRKHANIIVLSRGGIAYGHFEIGATEPPNERDRKAYDKTRFVYLVESSTIYHTPVPLRSLGIKHIQFGRPISEAEFDEVQRRAGGIHTTPKPTIVDPCVFGAHHLYADADYAILSRAGLPSFGRSTSYRRLSNGHEVCITPRALTADFTYDPQGAFDVLVGIRHGDDAKWQWVRIAQCRDAAEAAAAASAVTPQGKLRGYGGKLCD